MRSLGLAADYRDDLRQDLLVDLFTRLKAFDPERSTLGAFAGRIVHNRATRLARRISRERRLFVELDAAITDRYAARCAYYPTSTIDIEIDRERAQTLLAPAQKATLANALACQSPLSVNAARAASRATVQRRLRDLRLTLLMAGAAAAA